MIVEEVLTDIVDEIKTEGLKAKQKRYDEVPKESRMTAKMYYMAGLKSALKIVEIKQKNIVRELEEKVMAAGKENKLCT